MKDLDFDELDKAVNSLMSKTDTTSNEQAVPISLTPAPQPLVTPQPQVSLTSVPISSNIPVVSLSSTPKSPIATAVPGRAIVAPPVKSFSPSGERPTSRPTVPAKRSGRFMDLVPSSSELQSPMKSPSPRQGTTLSPINENIVADTPAPVIPPEPVVPPTPQVSAPSPRREFSQSIPASVSPLAASMSMTARAKHDDMPDPLDIHQQAEDGSEDSVLAFEATVAPSVATQQSNEPIQVPRQSVATEPTVSPFLTDAKVDKRPLGNSNASSASPESSGMPAELNTDLLEVESDRPTDIQTKSSGPVRAQQSAELTPPISIAQQYKQQPRSGDQSHAAVYDTAAHPVTHPEKKKSNLLLIVVIAAIIIIGGGGVATLFYLGYI